jgi:integrase
MSSFETSKGGPARSRRGKPRSPRARATGSCRRSGRRSRQEFAGSSSARTRPIVVFAAETGLRPSEWIAIQHADIQRDDGVLVIERSVSRGRLKAYGKTARSRRRVPLSRRALGALDSLPRRLDTRLVFPSPRGKHLDLENWRRRDWHPALDAAGIPSRRIYDLRHTFATHALAAGLSIFEVARFMGTSVRVIDSTYGHLAHGSEQLARQRLDVWALNGRGSETGTQ